MPKINETASKGSVSFLLNCRPIFLILFQVIIELGSRKSIGGKFSIYYISFFFVQQSKFISWVVTFQNPYMILRSYVENIALINSPYTIPITFIYEIAHRGDIPRKGSFSYRALFMLGYRALLKETRDTNIIRYSCHLSFLVCFWRIWYSFFENSVPEY